MPLAFVTSSIYPLSIILFRRCVRESSLNQAGVELVVILVVVIVLLAVAVAGLAYKLTQKNKRDNAKRKEQERSVAASPAASPEVHQVRPQWQEPNGGAPEEQVALNNIEA